MFRARIWSISVISPRIDGVDLERGGRFRCAHPQTVADADFSGIFSESNATR
jgi:hypothetical protein